MSPSRGAARVDRAAAVRRALVELVAERGLHGTSVAAVAKRAGVAAGTIYVHYASKDELVLAAFAEVKRELGEAALADVDPRARPAARFRAMWHGLHAHLASDPPRARFLAQIETSPYARVLAETKEGALEAAAAAPDLASLLIDLPPIALYDLAFGPAVRLAAAADAPVAPAILERLATACWRAVTKQGT